MFSERLQILVSPEQRTRWEAEAERRGTSMAALIRESVDHAIVTTDRADREEAVGVIGALKGRFLTPDELDRLVDEERVQG